MPRFLLLLSPDVRGAADSAGELGRRTCEFAHWVDALRRDGALRSGARLAGEGWRVARDPEGVRSRRGASSRVGLYFVIESPDWAAALARARACPVTDPGTIDVFELETAELP